MATAGLLSPNNINYRPPAAPLAPGITGANVSNQNQSIDALAKYYQGYYDTDETLQAQRSALAAQLRGAWSGVGGFVPQAQQLLNQFGGPVPGAVANYNAPQWNGSSIGMSLLQALSNPEQVAAAQNNPFSTMALLNNHFAAARNQGFHNLGGRGLGRSGAVDAFGQQQDFNALQQRYDATNKFLDALNTGYGNVLGNVDKAAQTESGYYQDAFTRASELIKNGILGTPTAAKTAPTTNTVNKAAPTTTAGPYYKQPVTGIPGIRGGLSPNTSLPQYTPQSQTYVGPTGYRSPMGAEQGMYHLTGGFKVTPRGRQLY